MATTKKTTAKTVAAAKETAPATEVKKAVAETTKETVKETAPAKKAPAKKTAPKKVAPKKPAAKTAPAKTTKSTAKAVESKVNFFVEFGGVQVSVDEVIENVKATYGKDAKEISVYLKPEESKAYFVADGEESEMDVFFC